MLKALFAVAFLIGSQAQAQVSAPLSDVCVKYMKCGSYDGKGQTYNADGTPEVDGEFQEKIIITPISQYSVRIEDYFYNDTVKPGDGYALNIVATFKADGTYTAVTNTKKTFFATGGCAHDICSFDFLPFGHAADTNYTGNSNILRFVNGGLNRYMMFTTDPTSFGTQRSVLTLQ